MTATSQVMTHSEPDAEAVEVRMPRLSSSQDRAAITRWFVETGQTVAAGDVLAEVGAGHTTMELEADQDGTVAALLAPAGDDMIAAGAVIARIAPAVDAEAADATPADPPAAMSNDSPGATPADVADPPAGTASEASFADALRAGLADAMRRDADVFIIGESVADAARCSAVVTGLAGEFGAARVVGTPITPHAVVGLAVGAAMAGLKPVVEVTAWALALQALDPIVSSAAKTRYRSGGQIGVPIVLRGRNGLWPGTGAMHSVSLASWFASVPGLKVVCPATPSCAKGLLLSAIADPDPVIILEADALYDVVGTVPDSDAWRVPIGKARVAREGTDVTVVAYGHGVTVALDAAEQLANEGVNTEVVDLRTLRPLDMPAVLASVRKTGRLLTLSDTVPACSIGAEICAAVAAQAFDALKAAPVRMDAADTIVPYAPNLEALVLPDAADVAAKALRLAGQSRL